MTSEETKTTKNDLTPEEEARRAKREERQGWIILTGIFVVGGLLVVLAALAT